ncbi:capsular biosynthesis protein [Microbulbifer hydrolyticus]|uniref:Capsular biosynthesis protein n=1 Tax=Microbulbifer hydrolyticus TaxID=48074 RepID=A0A6P1TGM4_9GAMM|nr:capsular biosynthesis protein [Microbulbifer hydrolyticus]MBB5212305.1 hypothetical protein [Microbulbifer hydrolyticus]QHQ39952.1 capsular biosynthesis protein [Microbulbifer hydrolyticus]
MIVFPMAGLSSRFAKAGFDKPKYMLEAKGETLFEHSVKGFSYYFNSQAFLFVTLDQPGIKDFVAEKCQKLGLDNFEVVILDSPTKGQADTVYQGLKASSFNSDESLTIFNIDTFRPGFRFPDFLDDGVEGYLETFVGSGKNWSNVVPENKDSQTVALTGEKQELSEFCCTGLYYWRSIASYMRYFELFQEGFGSDAQLQELYIAPMYNLAISQGRCVKYSVVPSESVIFCGVPQEYYDFIES